MPPNGGSGSVSMSWYWERLPAHSQSGVEFKLSDHSIPEDDPRYRAAMSQHGLMYPYRTHLGSNHSLTA
jgi:hypothetical protein